MRFYCCVCGCEMPRQLLFINSDLELECLNCFSHGGATFPILDVGVACLGLNGSGNGFRRDVLMGWVNGNQKLMGCKVKDGRGKP